MTLEPYKNDAEGLQIAQPIIEQNRTVLHSVEPFPWRHQ